ncbi:hypothetical protein [Arthrobacter sp. ISL-72]|uniref:hypothetical protein n=1 Tax=Arthrobacter sp. ISL-72 TaxID=2819114 RepID=UPI001BEB13DB|nr:hypothetical protein [Arthrobacter sp. ISL-72]MBT2594066.1 hypothetical protein [Arthrobacter sp. ISL-72]
MKGVIIALITGVLLSGCSSSSKIADVEPPKTGLSDAELETWASNNFLANGISADRTTVQAYTITTCRSLIGELSELKSVSQLVRELDRIEEINQQQAQIIVATSVRGECPDQLDKWESYRKAG